MDTSEMMILTMIPEHIKFLARDEQGDLWGLKHEPIIKKDDKGSFLSFGGDYKGDAQDINDVYSLSVFNHLYKELPNLGALKIR